MYEVRGGDAGFPAHPISLTTITRRSRERVLFPNIIGRTLVCDITTPPLMAFSGTLPVSVSIKCEKTKATKRAYTNSNGRKRIRKKLLENHGLRRLGVPGLELNADPILYGVDVPLLILGSLDSPKYGESTGVAGLEFVADCDAILSSLYWFRI